jgi:hypothetical protein
MWETMVATEKSRFCMKISNTSKAQDTGYKQATARKTESHAGCENVGGYGCHREVYTELFE